jgi:hypothetical protein
MFNNRKLAGSLITIIVVAMLVFMGPAQAVTVMISGLEPSYTPRTPVKFRVSMEINAPDQFVPITDISLDITGPANLNRIFSVDGMPESGDHRIRIDPVQYPRSTDYGYGIGCEDDNCYNFGTGDGYGKGKKKTLKFIYDVSININGLPAGDYNVIANLNTGKDIKPAFSSEPKEFAITSIIKAKIDVEPDRLNLKSNGKYVTVDIKLPEGYNAADIDVTSIRLNGIVHALPKPIKKDHNELKVNFDTASVKNILSPGVKSITITGNFLTGGLQFTGSDTINVIAKGKDDDKGKKD